MTVRSLEELKEYLCHIRPLLLIVQDYLQPSCTTWTQQELKDYFFAPALVELHYKHCFRCHGTPRGCREAQNLQCLYPPKLESAVVVVSS